jgi:hypothetical protein
MFKYTKLEDFTYHILQKEEDITPFIKKWLKPEWEKDHQEHPDQPWTIEWLEILESGEFKLETIDLKKIKPRKDLMDYVKDGYSFMKELKERSTDREESMLRGSSIEPLIVKGSNMELMDGYTRYMVLKKHNQKKVYAYVAEKHIR